MKKKSNSIDQQKLKILCDSLCDNIDEVLNSFGLEYRHNGKFVSMSCPIHGGDNDSALNLYHVGDTYRGNWKCRTHQCEKVFKSSIIGFIRGILSRNEHGWTKDGDDTVSFKDSLEYSTKLLNIDLSKIRISRADKEKNTFVSNSQIIVPLKKNTENTLKRNQIRKLLEIPSKYFIDRGFSSSILNKYDVGDCFTQGREMFGRAVVPIYDTEYTHMIGCTGRTIDSNVKPKWRHNKGFRAEECLYNFWFAKENIKQTGTAILVESPGNVWKLEENNIHNSLGIFGSSLNDRQKMLLDTSGAMELVLIMDSDEAGESARQQIQSKCSKTYNIKNIRLTKNDIADMSTIEISEQIKRVLGY